MTLAEAPETALDGAIAPVRVPFSAARVNRVIAALARSAPSVSEIRARWLQAVATRVTVARADVAPALLEVLGVAPGDVDHLQGLTIGEVGVCYEALLSTLDRSSRKSSGQFFTPDDAAQFMAQRTAAFGDGVWLDPCCGVGNLAWHLAGIQEDPDAFIRERLILIDRDETALRSAVALLAADYAAVGEPESVRLLAANAVRRDFLAKVALPAHDFVIVNPPYARAAPKAGYETGRCSDLFAYFMERVAKTSRGFVAVTPASYLSAPKFQPLRDVIDRESTGGDIFVFDNVPDTLFRGYKFGSNNTSKTNFVRAAITVYHPGAERWQVTPILRWQAAARSQMFNQCHELLGDRRIGPHGEWAKLVPGLEQAWDLLLNRSTGSMQDLVVASPTPFSLDVGLTPRYYISATYRTLDRGSKATLYFRTAADRDTAAIVLNSSVPYLWWRALDGGVTLPRRVLMSVPVPAMSDADAMLVSRLRASEQDNLVSKLNAGRENENVKHPGDLVDALNAVTLPGRPDLSMLYRSSMFPLPR